MCSLVFLVAFEALAVTTVMPVISRQLHGQSLYALAFAAPIAVGERFCSAIPNAEPLVVMQDCAHWPQWEKPDEFNDLHLSFLARHIERAKIATFA